MKNESKNILPAVIIGACIIIASQLFSIKININGEHVVMPQKACELLTELNYNEK